MGFWKRFKSSITGLFVKPAYAAQNPESTYAQKVKKPVRKAAVVKAQSRVARKASKAKPKKR